MTTLRLESHPLFVKAQQEIDEQNARAEQERRDAAAEAQRLLHARSALLERDISALIARYEEQRAAMNETLREIFHNAQSFSRGAGCYPLNFREDVFCEVNIPQLEVKPQLGSVFHMPSGFSTTKAAVMSYFASSGTDWNPRN